MFYFHKDRSSASYAQKLYVIVIDFPDIVMCASSFVRYINKTIYT